MEEPGTVSRQHYRPVLCRTPAVEVLAQLIGLCNVGGICLTLVFVVNLAI